MTDWGARLAALNAILNGTAAIFLAAGFGAIRQKNVKAHRLCMVTAFIVSMVFLVSYLTRVNISGIHRFPDIGFIRTVYLVLLTSHITLAAITPVLVLRTLFLAWKKRFCEHRAIAKWTYPIWMYVSLTGVVVYWMIYHYLPTDVYHYLPMGTKT